MHNGSEGLAKPGLGTRMTNRLRTKTVPDLGLLWVEADRLRSSSYPDRREIDQPDFSTTANSNAFESRKMWGIVGIFGFKRLQVSAS